jgi:LysR family transcriptional regulator of abg operon
MVVGQLERATEELARLRGDPTGKLSIAVTPLVMLTFMSEAISLFRHRMPAVQLEIFEGLTAVALPRLREGTLDIGIVPLTSAIPGKEFESEPLFSYESCLIVRRGHASASKRSVHDLLDQDWVVNYTPASYEGLMQNLFWRHGAKIAPSRLHCAHSNSLMLELVRHNDMLSHCLEPLLLIDLVRDWVQPLQVAERFETSRVSVVGLRAAMRSQAGKCFVDCLTETIRKRARSAREANRKQFDLVEFLF